MIGDLNIGDICCDEEDLLQITRIADLDIKLRKLGLKRTNKFGGIGKEISGKVYLHKNYEHTLPYDELQAAKNKLSQDYDYQVIKYNLKTGEFSFIQSKDFDTNPEPSVNGGVAVKPDGTTSAYGGHGWIYHHKFLFVADDYEGFDVEESKLRSLQWASLPFIDKARVGQRKFWDTNVVPLLKDSI